jgi:hypothetical protein
MHHCPSYQFVALLFFSSSTFFVGKFYMFFSCKSAFRWTLLFVQILSLGICIIRIQFHYFFMDITLCAAAAL